MDLAVSESASGFGVLLGIRAHPPKAPRRAWLQQRIEVL